MSSNRHMSSRRKFSKTRNRRRKSSQQTISYESLEERRLLAVDIGLNYTSSTFGRALSPPNLAGGVGPNHVVEVIDGQFKVFDKVTGSELVNKSMDDFWLDTTGPGDPGDPGAESDEDMVAGANNSRVLYDADTRRWFITSVSQADVITGAPGAQRPVLLAVSRTSNPTQDWQSTLNFYDIDANPLTPPEPRRGGFMPNLSAPVSTNLAVDDLNVYVTVGEANGQGETWAFRKFEDLVVPTPVSTNPFGAVGGAYSVATSFVGSPNTHWGQDAQGVEVGTFGLYTPASGDRIMLTQISNPDDIILGDLEFDVPVPVDPYEAPPIFVRQLFDPDIVNSGAELLASTVRHGNSLWAVHAIRGQSDGSNPGNPAVSALRWYEINLDTKTVAQSGTIEDPALNYIYPSIAITQEGHVAISFTSAAVDKFPTSTVAIGYSNNGVMTFEDPVDLKDGEGGYFDGRGNFWGNYMMTVADPSATDKVWAFTQWSDDSDDGQTQITELTLIGMSPTLEATVDDNTIVVRRSILDNTQIEVVIDDVVMASYEETVLYSLTIDGMGGDDTFVIDTVNGEIDINGGVHFLGDGDDQIEMRTDQDINWEIGLDGGGDARVGDDFPNVCDPNSGHEDVVTFNLNFEANSLWFDATPYGLNGYATRGDALRGELQNYFDNVMAPIFAGTYEMTIDINDDETDTFASAEAFGFGFEDVNGQNLWVASPWSILTGRGDRNGPLNSDARIDYNLELDLYAGDFEALLQNVSGGLTRNQFFRVLGMQSEIPNETQTFDPRGTRNLGTVLGVGYRDINGNPIIGNYDSGDNTFEVLSYVSNPNWAGDGTGIYFVGYDDSGAEMQLVVNSNTELIDFDTLASSLAGTSRNGDWHDIIEQDRAFLRGMGYTLNPIDPPVPDDGLLVTFVGLDQIQSGDGVDDMCVRSSNVDLEIRTGIGNDNIVVTGLGVGAIDLFGEDGDDTYTVVFSPAGVITIGDSVGSENDTLIGLGTASVDVFVFVVNGVEVNAGLLVHQGIENVTFDGRESDDIFEVRAATPDFTGLSGGDGIDTFIVNDQGNGANGNVLTVSVNDPAGDPADQLLLDITSHITDAFLADTIENLQVDGLFVIDGVNGTPTAPGGLNLLGDGDDRLQVESSVDADWVVDGDGSGNVTMDVDPMTFVGMTQIMSGYGVDTFDINATNTDLMVHTRDGEDVININNTGLGFVTVEAGIGNDGLNVFNSGGGVDLYGNEGSDAFEISDSGTGVTNMFGNQGDDTFSVLNSGSAGLNIFGNGANDTVTINNPLGTAPIVALGGEGDDLFDVIDSGLGDLDLAGETGDDTYIVSTNQTSIFIIDSVGTENDTLIVNGTVNDDSFDFGSGNWSVDSLTPSNYTGIENFELNGLAGNDTFNVDNLGTAWDDNLVINGDAGDDSFIIGDTGNGIVTLLGGADDDHYQVTFNSNTNVTIDDSSGFDTFLGLGTAGADLITVNPTTADVNGGQVSMSGVDEVTIDALGGNDQIDVVSTIGNTTVLGGAGTDVFNISSTMDGNVFRGNGGNDVFNILFTENAADFFGDDGQDTFNVATTTGNGDYFGGDGDDTFNIESATGLSSFFGEDGMDLFNITNHEPLGSPGLIEIDGGAQRNRMVVNGYQAAGNFVTVTNNRISGMSAVPIQYQASGSFSVGGGVDGITLNGSDGENDGFEISSLLAKHSVTMNGLDGNDLFTVRAAALGGVSSDGQEGSDLYRYAIGSDNNRFLFARDTGTNGSDRIVATLTDLDDDLVLSGESFRVRTDNFGFNKNFESMIINTREGNDTVDINRLSVNFLRVMTQGGDDQIELNNFTGVNAMLLESGSGNDNIMVNAGTATGSLTAFGGNGNDNFVISDSSYGNAIIDGQEGSDSYLVEIVDRSDRFVVARDSGTFGNDSLTVVGTVLNDFLTLRSGVASTPFQRILYNDNTEVMNLLTGGSGDNVQVFGVTSPETNIDAGPGHDLVFVNSTFGTAPTKELNVDLGLGNDNMVVRGTQADTTTTIRGREGNDNISLGSSYAENSGNLDLIQGHVNIFGDEDDDRIYMNDFARTASYNYDVGPTYVRNGGSPSNFFAGITYDGTIETLRLDATNYRNHINVNASFDTKLSFFGNGGYNTIDLLGDPDADGREFFGTDGGQGFWRFDNGFKDVFFSDFFMS